MRLTRTTTTLVIGLAITFALPILSAPPAAADAASPAVGECFLVADAQMDEEYWPGLEPVPCAGPHSFEVTAAGRLPADVNAFTFAESQCDYRDVWSTLGINQATAGEVHDPVRIDAFWFAVRGGGSVLPGWVCGAGPVAFRGKAGAVLVPMTGSAAAMTPATRTSLLFCNSAKRGRGAFADPITVPCSTRPRWQVRTWIEWGQVYAAFPGEKVLAAGAAKRCGPGASYSYPTRADWKDGSRRSFCYTKVG